MRLGSRGTRTLKTVHLVFTALWVGGVCALLPLALSVNVDDPSGARETYLNLRSIAWNVVGWGGIGSFGTGLALGLLTPWGIFREQWTGLKLCLTVFGVLFGMFYVERHMLTGLALLESDPDAGARSAFAHTHATFLRGLIAQMALFGTILAIAVFKPSLTAGRFGGRLRAAAARFRTG